MDSRLLVHSPPKYTRNPICTQTEFNWIHLNFFPLFSSKNFRWMQVNSARTIQLNSPEISPVWNDPKLVVCLMSSYLFSTTFFRFILYLTYKKTAGWSVKQTEVGLLSGLQTGTTSLASIASLQITKQYECCILQHSYIILYYTSHDFRGKLLGGKRRWSILNNRKLK